MKTRNSLYAIFLCAALSLSGINAQAESKLTVNYLANEQSVVAVSEATRFLLLPVQDDAPEAKVGVISGTRVWASWLTCALHANGLITTCRSALRRSWART